MCTLCALRIVAPEVMHAGLLKGSTNSRDLSSVDPCQAGAIIAGAGWANNTVTYGFRAPASQAGFAQLDNELQLAIESVLDLWSDVADIRFAREGRGEYTNSATMLFSGHSGPGGAGYAWAYAPGDSAAGSIHGDVFLNLNSSNFRTISPGTFAYLTLIHEIGHAIGLLHPGNYNGGSGGYSERAAYIEDTRQYSVMSYFSASNTGAEHGQIFSATPLLHDIAAVQVLYGPNLATRAGDTIYGFNANADRAVFHLTGDRPAIFAVWDAGGNDTFDFSGYSQNQLIDLRQAHFSDVGGLTKNVAIAVGAAIENGIGGSGNDVLIGNELDNALTGGKGDDQISGAGGNDRLVYTSGLDRLDGGDDTDIVDLSAFGSGVEVDLEAGTARDRASGIALANLMSVEAIADTGFDDVLSGDSGDNRFDLLSGSDSVDGRLGSDTVDFGAYRAPVNVALAEGRAKTATGTVVTLAGIENIVGTEFDDRVAGDARDNRIDGGEGGDVMAGGKGDDVYIVDDVRDQVVERADEGLDTIVTNLAYIDLSGTNVEQVRNVGRHGARIVGNEHANTIWGNVGSDMIDGGLGADRMQGGHGNDVYFVDNPADAVEEAARGGGRDAIVASTSYRLPVGVEVLMLAGGWALKAIGNSADNVLDGTGSSGRDRLAGRLGDDRYYLGAGDRVIEQAGGGTDTVFTDRSYQLGKNVEGLTLLGSSDVDGAGNSAANRITGNAGDNRLDGRGGCDVLKGGAGHDQFVFSSRLSAGTNIDRIADFATGADKIVLDSTVFRLIGSHLAAGKFRAGEHAEDLDDRIIYDRTHGTLYLDADGSESADAILFARLTPGTVLSHSDFLLM